MAGRPQLRQNLEILTAREDEIFEWLGDGKALEWIAVQAGVVRKTLMRWINETEDRAGRYSRARTGAADAIADDVRARSTDTFERARLGIADQVEVAAAKLANETDRWLAGIWDRERYGERNTAQVQVNLQGLVLEALRQPATASPGARPADVLDVQPVEPAPPGALTLEDLL